MAAVGCKTAIVIGVVCGGAAVSVAATVTRLLVTALYKNKKTGVKTSRLRIK